MQPPNHDRLAPLLAQITQISFFEKVRLLEILASALAEDIGRPAATATRTVSAPAPEVVDLQAVTYRIIGCAMAVHRKQGPGLREDTYQRDLDVHFAQAGLFFLPQHNLEVFDSKQGGKLVGYYIPDFIVADQVVVEIKALGRLDNSHLAQVIGYLAVTGCPVGLLIDFASRSLKWRRILPPRKLADYPINHQWLFVPDRLRDVDKTNSGKNA